VVICLERVADLHMAQLMPLPLTVSCCSKIQIVFTFLVPAHPSSPGQRAVRRVCVCVTNYAYVTIFAVRLASGICLSKIQFRRNAAQPLLCANVHLVVQQKSVLYITAKRERLYGPDDVIGAVETGACTVGQHPARVDAALIRDGLTRRRVHLVLARCTQPLHYTS